MRRVAPRGVDIVLDAVGGASWRHDYALLAPAGRLICFGVSGFVPGPRRNLLRVVWQLARFPRFGPISLMNLNRAVAGVNMGHLWNVPDIMLPQLAVLLDHARAGAIRPRIDRAFPFSQAADAHRYIHERRNIGKVMLVPDPAGSPTTPGIP